jgi:Fibronectin type III domain
VVYGKLTRGLRVLDTRLRSLRIGGLIIWIGAAFELKAALVTLAWDPSLSPNIAGYRLRSGTTSGVYTQTIEVGNTTSALLSNLVTGKTYFFMVTAYNTQGVESGPSNEVSYPAPTSSATPTATPKPTASPGSAAMMLSPQPGSTFTSSRITFKWSVVSTTNYGLLLGNSPGTADIYTSGTIHAQSTTVSNIPTDGRNIYVTLYSQVNNAWISNTCVYKALKASSTPTPTPTPSPVGTGSDGQVRRRDRP